MKKYLVSIILFVFLAPFLANAQTRVDEQISINFSPRFPGPNDLVFVDIESYNTDLNKSLITWIVDGEVIESNVGLKEFSFFSKDLGVQTRLEIRITKQDGKVVSKKYNIIPGEIDLYYEPQTYTPPFYKGKPEFSYQSDLKLVALPSFVDQNGNKIPDNQITYKWEIDGDVDLSGSGIGKNTYMVNAGIIPRSVRVVLEASPVNSSQAARIVENISPIEPTILIYENNPIYGTIFDQNIKSGFQVNRDEIELIAVPYNFSNNILDVGNFRWFLNNERVENFLFRNITFRKVDDKESSNNVTIEIENPNKTIQIQREDFILNFGSSNNEFNF